MSLMWGLSIGLGCLWLGLQIVWVAGLPWQLRRAERPAAEPGSVRAFMLFWIDQYGWIGVTLSVVGVCLILSGLL